MQAETPPARSWFSCFGAPAAEGAPAISCGARYPLTEVATRCPRCGGLLDVEHDLASLKATPGAAWRELFDRRAVRAPWPYTSGVWGKKEWVCPDLPDADIVSLGEGHTPLLPMPRLGAELGVSDLWIKQCGHNPTGSFKDLGMTMLVSMVQHLRAALPGRRVPAVACASTGDTSAALAAYCARAGMRAVVFLPAGQLSDEQLSQPLSHFAITAALDTDFDGCMALVARFCQRHGVYLANSMNPLRIEGQKTLSVEIAQQLGWEPPDWVVVPGGNLGHTTAIGRGFELLRSLGLCDKTPRLLVAQAQSAAPLHKAFVDHWRFAPLVAQPTMASAIRIGNPVNVHKAIAVLQRLDGVVEAASEDELLRAAVLGDRHGLYCDPHTGVALAALAKQRAAGTIKPHERVVVVSTAHGLKFGALKRAHHQPATAPPAGNPKDNPKDNGDGAPRNPPLLVRPELAALEDALLPRLL
jgi:threonine synthase